MHQGDGSYFLSWKQMLASLYGQYFSPSPYECVCPSYKCLRTSEPEGHQASNASRGIAISPSSITMRFVGTGYNLLDVVCTCRDAWRCDKKKRNTTARHLCLIIWLLFSRTECLTGGGSVPLELALKGER